MKHLHLFRMLFATMLVSAVTAFTACTDNDDTDFSIPSIAVSATDMTFDKDGGAQSFDIVTNGTWKITGTEDASWMTVKPALEGAGNETITVNVAALAAGEGGHSANLKISLYATVYGVHKLVDTKEVKVAQTIDGEEISNEAIYKNNFDKAPAEKQGNYWPYLDQSDVWKNQEGTGAANVEYSTKGCSVRTTGASGGYLNASGVNKIYFGEEFVIGQIALPEGKTNYSLKFGANYFNYDNKEATFDYTKFSVAVGNGTNWTEVPYKMIDGSETQDPKWMLMEVGFTLKKAAENLSVKFIAKERSRYSIDDVLLTEGVGGVEVDLNEGSVDPEPEPQPTDAIYANNFDKADAVKGDKGWPYLDQTDVWQNQTGSGASTVSYESKSISVRQSGKLSGGYTGASAHNKIFFGSMPNEFVIKDITLPAGKKNFRLTFGGNYYDFNAKSNTFDVSKMPIRLGNGTGWSGNITYTKIEGSDEVDPYWTLFAADFTLPEGTKTLSIKFSAEQASVFAIDDVVLAEGQGGQAISFDGSVDPEPEPTPGNSIADIIKGGEGQAVSVEAQIVAKHKFGFVLQDATGRLYVYTAAEQKIGDTVKVEGTTGSFNGMFQIGKGATVTLVKAGEFTQPTPKVWDGAQIESYTKGSTYAIEYVQFEGTLNVTENPKYPGSFYYNVVLNGTSVKGSLVNPVDEEGIKALNNKKVTVKGYSVGAAGKNKDFFNVVAVEVSGEGGVTPEPEPEPEPGPDPAPGVHTAYSGWAELPNEDLSKKNSEFFYASHLCPDIYTASRNKARNFTTCYSKSKICPVWVAAPLHVSYAGSGRHDAYKPDPDIPCTQNGRWDGYTRGHMLGSAERNRTVATNHQVFYYSNIGPQLGSSGYFNTGGGQWNTAEGWVDLQWRNSNDTCYQVVGCYWDPQERPKFVKGTEIPTHYYTVLLKAKKGVKKWVVDCSADELQAIVIWVRHKSYSKGEVVKPNNFEAKGMFKTVEEVERLTGHKFFMNVPNAPKSKFNTSDWNF